MRTLILLISALAFTFFYFSSHKALDNKFGKDIWMADFRVYYEAANNNFDYYTVTDQAGYNGKAQWIYHNWTSIFWKPFTLLKYETARTLWYILSVFASLFIIKKLLEIQHGWILLLPTYKVISLSLQFGNVYPILTAISFIPAGMVLASLVKPTYYILLVVWFATKSIRDYKEWRKLLPTK